MTQRAQRHRGPLGIVWILHDRQSAGALDLTQTDGSIVEGTAEYDADRASTVCVRGTAKQRVNSRTVAVP